MDLHTDSPLAVAADRMIDQVALDLGIPGPSADAKAKAGRFRSMAETIGERIRDLSAPRAENTPKRAREAMGRRLEAANLERAGMALITMAAALEAGNLPAEYQSIKTRAQVEALTGKQSESTSYYVVTESAKYRDESIYASNFRAWVSSHKTEADKARDADQEKARRIADLERDVRFTDIPGFFPTPPALVSDMIRLADIQPGMSVLEPSAGKGDIAEAIKAAGCDPLCYEINYSLGEILKAKGLKLALFDFLKVPDNSPLVYDRVLMNPPFENGQDMAHVRHAFGFLKPGGRLVAIISASPIFRENKASTDFRAWLEGLDFSLTENPDGSFVGAFKSTGVKTFTLVINKAA